MASSQPRSPRSWPGKAPYQQKSRSNLPGAQAKVLRIGIIQGGKILEERIIRKRESVSVGQSEKAHFVVATNKLPGRYDMFALKGNDYFLNFTSSMTGRVSLRGDVQELSTLKETGLAEKRGKFYQVPLDDQTRGKIMVEDSTILFQFVAPPPVQPRPQLPAAVKAGLFKNLELFISLAWIISFIAHVSLGSFLWLADYPEPDRWDQFLALQEQIGVDTATFEKPKKAEKDGEGDEKKEEDDKKDKKDVKKKPSKTDDEFKDVAERSPEEVARQRAERRAQVAEMAAQRGINKILGSLGPDGEGAIADVLRGGDVGADQDELLSQVHDLEVATEGSALSHMSAGKDSGTAAGVDQITLKGGDATVKTGGAGERTIRAKVKRRKPSAVDGSGVLSADEVAKVVSRRLNALKGCHERALKRNPDLRGKVVIRFTIAASGKVTKVDLVVNELTSEVGSCIKRTFKLFRFPPPQGGSATFEYPFLFIPAS